jgi:hypothetical protein
MGRDKLVTCPRLGGVSSPVGHARGSSGGQVLVGDMIW